MIEQQTTWAGRAATERHGAKARSPRLAIEIHPLRWMRNYQIATAVILLGLALVLYLVQANQGAWIGFGLNHAQAQQTQLNAGNAQLLAQQDRLLAEPRIDTIATTRLHMIRPALTSALWLRVRIPAPVPTMPHEPAIATGPLPWLRGVIRMVRDSL